MKAVKKYPVRKNCKRMWKYGVVAFVVLLVSVSVLNVLFPQPAPPYHPNPNTFYFKAVIVDEESLTSPNPYFVQNATTTLQNAGFAVDYIGGGSWRSVSEIEKDKIYALRIMYGTFSLESQLVNLRIKCNIIKDRKLIDSFQEEQRIRTFTPPEVAHLLREVDFKPLGFFKIDWQA